MPRQSKATKYGGVMRAKGAVQHNLRQFCPIEGGKELEYGLVSQMDQ